jgi:hypothetical protein
LTHLRIKESEKAGGAGMAPHAATFAKLLETNKSLVELAVVGCREAEPAVKEWAREDEAKIAEALERNRAIAQRAAAAAGEAARALSKAPAAHWQPEELGHIITHMILERSEHAITANAALAAFAYFALQQPEQPPQQDAAAAPAEAPLTADAPEPARD